MVAGKLALVTGAGAGIGRATAVELARQGAATVLVVDRDLAAAEATVGLVEAAGARGAAYRVDVADEAALVEACATGAILTVEDHNVESGMGSILASTMARKGLQAKIKLLGVDHYADSGKSSDLYAAMGLDAAGIAKSFATLKGI